ncbi:hypothetical protein G1K75_12060 [Tenacibaculum finnmarkense]|uniref:hypothetical protein n=2 Tax=Flavobacteriaceae TaxID=49546 RepID=UPI00187B5D2B|nr:hypothetical protein [Tenacibaculum finnmarkense]MCD8415947.1 hypothetical protein [Tenacibaculum dicentrarchi]MBE7635099.1 hypothetical protein [Tenacibaculum finnmarkense genomovar ulcerans]MBE7649117.1 hypothetical protein [Tenacibaculum finnmarkense genomovar ulcerans]MCD8421124.1 hypothetical protein [Tenacibaculum dicentrarchi]MCD8431048.1 hypothetical protein [Tenacibaculum finnmarkense genomovar ulcerans]
MTTVQAHQMIENLYKEVQYSDDKVFYDLKVFNGVCNYKIWVNDVPVYHMFKGARGELSFTINTEILKAGKQTLKIRMYPYWNPDEQKWGDYLNKYAGLDVEIREMEWDSKTRKFDFYPIFTYQTPREGEETLQDKSEEFLFEEGKKELPYYEETVTFEAKVPYNLTGWSNSVDLTKENQEKLFKEVEAYYLELIKDFENKDISSIAQKYYIKEKEIAQALFLKEKEMKSRWHEDFLSKVTHPTAKGGEIRKPFLEFYGDGKLVSLLINPLLGSKALRMIRDKDNGKKGYFKLDIYLHRPTAGAPLEMIR